MKRAARHAQYLEEERRDNLAIRASLRHGLRLLEECPPAFQWTFQAFDEVLRLPTVQDDACQLGDLIARDRARLPTLIAIDQAYSSTFADGYYKSDYAQFFGDREYMLKKTGHAVDFVRGYFRHPTTDESMHIWANLVLLSLSAVESYVPIVEQAIRDLATGQLAIYSGNDPPWQIALPSLHGPTTLVVQMQGIHPSIAAFAHAVMATTTAHESKSANLSAFNAAVAASMGAMLAEGKISLVTLHSKYKAFCDRPAQLGGVPFEQVPFDAFDTQLKLCGLEVFQDPTERKEMVAGVVSVAQEAPPQIVETAQPSTRTGSIFGRLYDREKASLKDNSAPAGSSTLESSDEMTD